jgi:hypothetical protein
VRKRRALQARNSKRKREGRRGQSRLTPQISSKLGLPVERDLLRQERYDKRADTRSAPIAFFQ